MGSLHAINSSHEIWDSRAVATPLGTSRRRQHSLERSMRCIDTTWYGMRGLGEERQNEDSLTQALSGVFLRVTARMAANKMIPSLNCCVLKRWRCRGQKRWWVIIAIPWPTTGRGEPPVPTPSSAAPSFSDSLFATTGKTILSHLRGRSGDFYLECYRQLACLFQETEEKNISENRWANLLQVRLSGSCYATHRGRLGSCWGRVGRGRTDGKLRADGQQTWEKPTHSVSTAHMRCAMMGKESWSCEH